MVKIQVESVSVELKQGVSAKNGKAYSIREQEAWMFGVGRDGKPQPHPQRIKITLDDEQQSPYPLGTYTLDPASLYVDRFGQIAIRARLKAAAAAQPVQRAA